MRVVLVLALALSACLWGCDSTRAAAPVSVADGASVSLRAGESATSGDRQLQFGFEQVIADSRCPTGVQCIWAGDAVVRVWWQHGSGPREVHDLHTTVSALTAVKAPHADIRLLSLSPWPVAGRAIGTVDYVATFAVAPASQADDPER